MPLLRSVVLSILFLATASLTMAAESAEPWLPITSQDLRLKDVPGNPGARAIQLYYSYYRNDNEMFVSVYRRIKVLTDAGRDYAHQEIELAPNDSIKELRARTIRPDGSIVEFHGDIMEKTLLKARGVKYLAKVIDLPDVTPGSIIEYSCIINLSRHHIEKITRWFLQSDLYTVKERFRFQPSQKYVDVASEWNFAFRTSEVMCSYSNKAGAPAPKNGKDGLMEVELENVAAFEGEEFMPPESDYEPYVMCYYGGHELKAADLFWTTWHKRLTEATDKWIGKPSVLRDASAQAIGGEADPEQKLRKLYARAQEIRNLSYEPEKTAKEEKKERLKPNLEPRDVLAHAYGTHWEIDATFAGLARAAGFDASMVAINDRYERTFSDQLLWLGQFEGLAVLVKLNGNDLFLDPGTRFCPFRVLPWKYAATTAVDYKAGAAFITTPPPAASFQHRVARIVLAANGSAKGEITVEFKGQIALQRKLDALNTDEAGRRKNLEEEVQSWLADGATVTMINSAGWDSTDDPLTARFSVETPSFAAIAGKRIAVPVFFLPTPLKSVFAHASRLYPMDFLFPVNDSDEVTVRLPNGYVVEEVPHRAKAGLSYASYELSTTLKDQELLTSRSLRFDGVTFSTDKYDELRNFFNVVHSGDGLHAVLQAASEARAEKAD